MAKYDTIWHRLKRDKSVVLAVPLSLHKRVIKGVMHAKDNDSVFKFECSELAIRYRLAYKCESARITLKLVKYIHYAVMTADSL